MEQSDDNRDSSQQSQKPNPPQRIETPVPDKVSENYEPSQRHQNGGNNSNGRGNWFARLWDEGPDRQLELILAFVIALSSLTQIGVAIWNDVSTSKQVDKIIKTAGGIEEAAQEFKEAGWRFSGAAIGINNAGWNAVGRLQDQANQVSRSANAAGRSADVAAESLESVQRAYIVFNNYTPKRAQDSTGTIKWEFTPLFENSGNTPAIGAVSLATSAFIDTKEIPEGIFKEGNDPTATLHPITLGPKGLQNGMARFIEETKLFGVNLGPNFENYKLVKDAPNFYFFGWVVYRDVIKHSRPHLTEYCRHMNSPGFQQSIPIQPELNFEACAKHNCTDEYCADYNEIVDYAISKTPK